MTRFRRLAPLVLGAAAVVVGGLAPAVLLHELPIAAVGAATVAALACAVLYSRRDTSRLAQSLATTTDRVSALREDLIATIAEGVMILDDTGTTVAINDEAAAILGVRASEVIGHRATPGDLGVTFLAVDGSTLPKEELPGNRVAAGGVPVRRQLVQIRRRDGSICSTLVNAARTTSPDIAARDQVILTFTDVTEAAEERRLREEQAAELATAHRHLSVAEELASVGVAVMDTSGKILSMSDGYMKIYAMTQAPKTIEELLEAVHPDDRAPFGRLRTEVLENLDAPTTFRPHRFRIIRRDGVVRRVEARSRALAGDDGEMRMLTMVHDITDIFEARRTLENREQALAIAQEIGRMGSTVYDVKTGVRTWSDNCSRLFGLEPGEVPSVKEFVDMVLPEDRPGVDRLGRWAATGPPSDSFPRFMFRITRPDGQLRYLEAEGRLIRDEDGSPDRILVMMRDATAAIEGRHAIEDREEALELAQEVGGMGSIVFDLDSHTSVWSNNATRLFGMAPGWSPRRVDVSERFHPDDREKGAAIASWMDSGAAAEGYPRTSFRIVRLDGAVRHLDLEARALRSDDGLVHRVLAVMQDVTEQEQAAQQLRAAHRHAARLLAAMNSVLIGLDADGRVTTWNHVAEETFGVSEDAATGAGLVELALPLPLEAVQAAIDHCARTMRPRELDEVAVPTPGGAPAILVVTVSPIVAEDGAFAGCLVIGVDMTERRELEARLLQSQKLEAVGQLAAGLAHEINTPSQYVSDNVYFVRDTLRDLQPVREAYRELRIAAATGQPLDDILERIVALEAEAGDYGAMRDEVDQAVDEAIEGITRITSIVSAMREFSHPGGAGRTTTDLNELLTNTATVARNEWKPVADVTFDLDDGLPLVPCYRSEIAQVILNLIVNAADAIAEAGPRSDGARHSITLGSRRHDGTIELRISDSGRGIPPEVQSKIFDPFFTTKDVGKGTGQGLAIARSIIVDKHGGTMTFETDPESGTTFIVQLPAPAGEVEEAA